MRKSSLTLLFLSIALLTGTPQRARAQAPTGNSIPWFKMQGQIIVVQNGTKSKPLNKDVTLPNGIRVEYRTQSLLLTSGSRVALRDGDMLSLNGEFIRKKVDAAPVMAPAPTPAAALVAPAAAPAATSTAFTYRPAAPVDGKLKGVVELGASGFSMFIIRIDTKRNWKLEKSELGNSLVMENMTTDEDIRNGLKTYIGKMLDFGVAARDIHFVVSSGAALSGVTARITKGLRLLEYVVTAVTPEQERALALRAALPLPYVDKAFVVDMDSATTKISWFENGSARVADTYGSEFYEKNIDAATMVREVKSKSALVPASLRGTCFIIGGVPYEMAKSVRRDQEPFTVLKSAEAYAGLTGAKMKSGISIYQAVAEATSCRQFVFGYDTPFTIGYLLSLP